MYDCQQLLDLAIARLGGSAEIAFRFNQATNQYDACAVRRDPPVVHIASADSLAEAVQLLINNLTNQPVNPIP